MVGNAVPPTLAFHLAKEIMEVLKESTTKQTKHIDFATGAWLHFQNITRKNHIPKKKEKDYGYRNKKKGIDS